MGANTDDVIFNYYASAAKFQLLFLLAGQMLAETKLTQKYHSYGKMLAKCHEQVHIRSFAMANISH